MSSVTFLEIVENAAAIAKHKPRSPFWTALRPFAYTIALRSSPQRRCEITSLTRKRLTVN